MKIAFFEVSEKEKPSFSGSFGGAEVAFYQDKLNEESVEKAKDAEIVCIFINSKINKKVIDSLPNLKFIATRSTGFDHIDCEYAESKGIKVSNVSGYGSHTVAEFAFSLILNLSRNDILGNSHTKELIDFNYNPGMEGFDLFGRTLGIVGTGKIGKNVVRIAKGFGMNIVAYDLYPDANFAKENGFSYKSLEDVANESDIITLHTPYNKENHHLINNELILKMKKGVYLINTARGELIDTVALVAGLKNGTIAGLGADVLENERILKIKPTFFGSMKLNAEEKKIIELNQELMRMPNTIITPHIAFYTKEAVEEIKKITIENILGFINGHPLNLVK